MANVNTHLWYMLTKYTLITYKTLTFSKSDADGLFRGSFCRADLRKSWKFSDHFPAGGRHGSGTVHSVGATRSAPSTAKELCGASGAHDTEVYTVSVIGCEKLEFLETFLEACCSFVVT